MCSIDIWAANLVFSVETYRPFFFQLIHFIVTLVQNNRILNLKRKRWVYASTSFIRNFEWEEWEYCFFMVELHCMWFGLNPVVYVLFIIGTFGISNQSFLSNPVVDHTNGPRQLGMVGWLFYLWWKSTFGHVWNTSPGRHLGASWGAPLTLI